jgi:hypothetical protein
MRFSNPEVFGQIGRHDKAGIFVKNDPGPFQGSGYQGGTDDPVVHTDHHPRRPRVISKSYIDAGTPFSLGCAKFVLIFLPILSSTSTLDLKLSG